MTNFKNDVDIALEAALRVLGPVDQATLKQLPESDRFTYALGEAAVAIAYSLRQLAAIREDELDERKTSRG